MTKEILPTTTCPICKKKILWTNDNPFRPFCCKRCQLIDLGEWINEGYTIPCDEEIEE